MTAPVHFLVVLPWHVCGILGDYRNYLKRFSANCGFRQWLFPCPPISIAFCEPTPTKMSWHWVFAGSACKHHAWLGVSAQCALHEKSHIQVARQGDLKFSPNLLKLPFDRLLDADFKIHNKYVNVLDNNRFSHPYFLTWMSYCSSVLNLHGPLWS